MSRARIVALSFVAALALSSGALAQGGGGGGGGAGGGGGGGGGGGEVGGAGVAQAALAVEQAERTAHREPRAPQAAGPAVRAETALLNPPAAKAVRLAMALLNPPEARAKIALTPQGRELGRAALVRTVKVNCNGHSTPTPSAPELRA